MRPVSFSITLSLLTVALTSSAEPTFNWHHLTPSKQLNYKPCFTDYLCARLSVPLNWINDTDTSHTVSLAITTLPAKVPSSDPSFGGTIILNPGGPGGSGVGFVQRFGKRLQDIADGKKHYEFLSFDPRGVGETTPQADCYGSRLLRDVAKVQTFGLGFLNAEDEERIRRILALKDGEAERCKGVEIMPFANTAQVARDIVEIAERVDAERSTRAFVHEHAQAALSIDGSTKDKTVRVNYWGFSYGTILGNTLASMFPGRINRIILDGVVDVHDYYAGTWVRDLQDSEAIIDFFFDTCYESRSNCSLFNANTDSSPKDIRSRVDELISALDVSPTSYVSSTGQISIVDGDALRLAFLRPIYHPLSPNDGFPRLADDLAAALKGNFTRLSSLENFPSLTYESCSSEKDPGSHSNEAQQAIACGDAVSANRPRLTLAQWKEYIQTLKLQSPTVGPFWTSIRSECSTWRVPPAYHFPGPFTTPPHAPSPNLRKGHPAAPILFTSNRLDPVTPLRNAFSMSAEHPGSSVLTLDDVGHCAATVGWSEEFNEIVRRYLDDGVVPENGTVVEADCVPFTSKKCEWPGEDKEKVMVESERYPRKGKPLMPFW